MNDSDLDDQSPRGSVAHRHMPGGGLPGGAARPGRLLAALLLNVSITVVQIVGGILSGSLALLADAAHNGSDAAALGIAYTARRIAGRKADRRRTFGYRRAEVVGALINLTILMVIGIFLLYEAGRRFLAPHEVQGEVMLIVAAIAFVEDGISAYLLYTESKDSLNVRSAFIHLFADTLATIGVIAGGILIMMFNLQIVDPLLTAGIALYIFVHGYSSLRATILILMESAPEGFEFDRMVADVEGLSGVEDMHHVHIWRLDEHRVALEAHIVVQRKDLDAIEAVKERVRALLRDEYGIVHATLEVETPITTDHDRSVVPRG